MRLKQDDSGEYSVELEDDFSGRVLIVETHDVVANRKVTEITVTRPSLKHVIGYAVLSLVFLAVAIAAAWWALVRAPQLGPQFGYAFYIADVVLGISAAIVLFGCMRSYAYVSGKQGSFSAEVGGPAALAVLVVVGGFYLARPPDSFPLTVRLSGDKPDAAALQGLKVIVDLESRRAPGEFTSAGEAVIADVPTSFIGQDIPVDLSPGRVHLKKAMIVIPSTHVIYLDVTVSPPPDPRRAEARDRVIDIRKRIRMTLMLQDEEIAPAFSAYRTSPTLQNWSNVQNVARSVLREVQQGVHAALEYDASYGPAMSQFDAIIQGDPIIDRSFTLREERREWNGHAFVLKEILHSGPPNPTQADQWMQDLIALYRRLEVSLQSIEAQLASTA
jgi:hypothetical protein